MLQSGTMSVLTYHPSNPLALQATPPIWLARSQTLVVSHIDRVFRFLMFFRAASTSQGGYTYTRSDHYSSNLRYSPPLVQNRPLSLECCDTPTTYTKHCAVSWNSSQLPCNATILCHPHSSLLQWSFGDTMDRRSLNALIKVLARKACLNEAHYSTRSFQIGVATYTTASAAGVSDCIIQTLGRWSSDAYQLYVRTPHTTLDNIATIMANCT